MPVTDVSATKSAIRAALLEALAARGRGDWKQLHEFSVRAIVLNEELSEGRLDADNEPTDSRLSEVEEVVLDLHQPSLDKSVMATITAKISRGL